MTREEMHALEKAAMSDPFLADALEGYQHAHDPVAELGTLRSLLDDKIKAPVSVPRIGTPKTYWWKIAASIVVVGGLSYLAYQFIPGKQETSVAGNDQYKQEQVVPTVDTSVQPGTGVMQENKPAPKSDDQNESKPATETATAPGQADHSTDTLLSKQNTTDTRILDTREQENAAVKDLADVPNKADSLKGLVSRSNNPQLSETKSSPNQAAANKKEQVEGYYENVGKKQVALDKSKKVRPIIYRSRVVDNNQNAVPFAVVHNLNNNANTLADQNGYFTINTSPDSLVLLNVSSAGFVSREFRLNRFNRKTPDLVLYETPEDSQPAEVSVVAELDDLSYRENEKKSSPPSPDTGWILFNQQIANNLLRDRESLDRGEVILVFTVSKAGKPTNIRVARSLNAVNDNEAIRLLREGPDWSVGSQSGDIRIIFRFK